jgi:uncharacterized protein
MGKFVIKTAKNGEFFFNLKAGNGETILTSEMYTTKSSCKNGIESVQNNCTDDKKYDRKLSTSKKHYFVLRAGNNQIIGNSELYESSAGMESGIASVKNNGTTTTIEE